MAPASEGRRPAETVVITGLNGRGCCSASGRALGLCAPSACLCWWQPEGFHVCTRTPHTFVVSGRRPAFHDVGDVKQRGSEARMGDEDVAESTPWNGASRRQSVSRRFGVRRRTIHEWIETGQLDRDLSPGGSQDSPRLDPSRGIIDSRLTDAVGNGWGEPSWSRCPPTAPAPPHDASRTRRRFVSSSTRVNVDLHVYVLAELVEHGHQPGMGEAAKLHVANAGKVR